MQPLRIFHSNMHLKWGGQPNRVLITAEGLRALGHSVTVAGPKGSMLVERARACGFAVFDDLTLKSGFRPGPLWNDVSALRKLFSDNRFDVVDTHGSQDTWAVRYALVGLDHQPAFVRTRHNTFPVSGNPFNKWLYRRIEHIITISPQVIPLLDKVVPPEKCTPIYSAPDPARFRIPEAREDVRAELGYAPSDKVIGVVGRLAPEKGHRYLIAAAPAILQRVPEARFLFVGTGRSRDELTQQIEELGLSERFRFTGFREDVPQLLQAFDLFVLCPTEGESLGTSILEAFLMERPVVATDVGGVSESVIDGVTGRLVAPGDSTALADAVIAVLLDPKKAREWALAGKARVQEFFTPEAIARRTEQVYLKVLQEHRQHF